MKICTTCIGLTNLFLDFMFQEDEFGLDGMICSVSFEF